MEVMEQLQQSFYDAVGGADTFHAIVSRFYELVAEDEILRRVYPQDDLAGAEERLRMFLEQYWGGPRTYSEQRGHPRLRMRHAPFQIGPFERDAWLRCMHTAIASIDSDTLDDAHRKELLEYLARGLVEHPDEVRVNEVSEDDGAIVLELSVADDDYGNVIGRGGRTAAAIRTVVKAAAVRSKRRVFVDIVDS